MEADSADLPISPNIIEIDGIFYYCNPETGTASVLNGRSCSGSIFIPESVVKEDVTYPVTSIDNNAFLGSGITTIIIPDSVSSIGAAAFVGCTSLESVTTTNPDNLVGGPIKGDGKKSSKESSDDYDAILGRSAFEGCSNLGTVIIPETIKTIDKYAFADCINLKSITIPSSVETICDYAFADCISLNEVIISDKAAWCKISFGIDSNPLHYANRLLFKYNGIIREINRLDIPDTVKSISAGAFSKCTNITSVYFQSTDVEIKENAFAGCTGINLIDFGNTVTSIGNSAFACCTGLKSLTIGEKVKSIGNNAFANCFNLKSVTIYPSVTSIGNFAFSGCSSLDKVSIYDLNAWCNIDFGMDANPLRYGAALLHIQNLKPTLVTDLSLFAGLSYIGKRAFQGYKRLKSVIIPDTVTSIGESAFAECEGLSEVTIGRAVLSIGNEAFAGCRGITRVTIPTIWVWCSIDFNGIHSNPLEYGRELYLGDSKITDLKIPSNLSQIKPRAFYNCRSISSVTIPESVEKIGEDAFFQCCGLEEVCISDIAKWCSIDFEYSGQGDIESNPLIYAHKLHLKNENEDEMITDLVIPEGVEQINKGTFCGCSTLTRVDFHDSITSISIDEYAFCDCSNLKTVHIPDSVSEIGGHAFSGCGNLELLSIAKSVKSIGEFAFYGCINLNVVYIHDLIAWCGIDFQGAHSNPLEYTSILLLKSDEDLDYTPITDLVITGNVTEINSRAFYGCRFLRSVTICNSVTSIGSQAFEGCSGLNDVVIPDSVTIIHNRAFKYCSGLKTVTIGKSVKSIGIGAFDYCKNLTEVHISDLEAWCNIDFGANPLEIAHNLYLNGEKIINLVIPGDVTTINNNSFRGCSSVESLAFAKSTNTNNGNVSEDHGGLESMTSQYSVKTIGANAFYGCKGLKSVTLPDSVEIIGESAFYGCKGMTDVTMGKRVTNIGPNAFTGCSKLKKVHVDDIVAYCRINFEGSGSNPLELTHNIYPLGDDPISDLSILQGVSKIQPGIFAKCYDLNKVTIGETVSEPSSGDSVPDKSMTFIYDSESISIIGENAFLECFNLTKVTIGDSVKTIEAGAFQVCTKLAKLTIGKSVMKIGYGAFFNCAMTSVTIPESVMRIEGLAFYCKDLTEIRCMNRFPIPISENVFKNYDATLEVPSGSKKFYSEDKVWGKFANIKEPDPPESDKPEETTTPSENPES